MKRLGRKAAALGVSLFVLAGAGGCSRPVEETESQAVLVAPAAPARQTAPGDPGEKPPAGDRTRKLVAEALRPSDRAGALPWRDYKGQRPLPGRRSLEQPDLPLPPAVAEVPRMPAVASARPVRPHPVSVEPPLARVERPLVPPERLRLPAAALVHLPGPDIVHPVPLPILAQAQPDRVPLTDPTVEASLAMVLAKSVPERTTPAPFERLNLPDPFENREAAALASPPAEDPTPPVMVVRTPGK
jgi:hypothetical protein